MSGIDIVGETYKQTKILEFFLKMPSDYWSKFLTESQGNDHQEQGLVPSENNVPVRTPILSRQQHYQNTTPVAYPVAANQFFSPLWKVCRPDYVKKSLRIVLCSLDYNCYYVHCYSTESKDLRCRFVFSLLISNYIRMYVYIVLEYSRKDNKLIDVDMKKKHEARWIL